MYRLDRNFSLLGSGVLALFSCNTAESPSADAAGTGTGSSTAEVTSSISISSSSTGPGDDGVPETGTTSFGTTDGSADSTGEPPPECMVDADCRSVRSPFCVEQVCTPCGSTPDPDARCAAKDPSSPLCIDDFCVQCSDTDDAACDEDHPICNTISNQCLPCTTHDQCPGDAACELFTGRCFPEDDVKWVNSAGQSCSIPNNSLVGVGTIADPWCNVSGHLDDLPLGGFRTFRFVDFGGPDNYSESIQIDGNRRIALLGSNPDEPPRIDDVASVDPIIHVTSTSGAVYLHQVHLEKSGESAVVLENNGSLYATSVSIRQFNARAIDASGGARLALVNSTVGTNSGDVATVSIDDGDAYIAYSTIIGGSFSAVALRCVSPASIRVRNSILLTRGGTPPDEISCLFLDMTNSATEGNFAGEGNVAVGSFELIAVDEWFADLSAADYHLQNDGPAVFADIAIRQASDFSGEPPYYVEPLTDIDGDPRPQTAGAMDYAGADRP